GATSPRRSLPCHRSPRRRRGTRRWAGTWPCRPSPRRYAARLLASVGHSRLAGDLGRPDADEDLARHAVAGAVLLSPVGAHVAAADAGGPVTQLVAVVG